LRFWAAKKQTQFKAKQSQSVLAPRPALGVEKTSLSLRRCSGQALSAVEWSQFISYWVLRDAYCEKEFEKTNPISKQAK